MKPPAGERPPEPPLRRWADPDGIRVILLDAGNTLVFLDYEAIANTVRQAGQASDPGEIERAEYRARLRVDRKYGEEGFTDANMWGTYFSWTLEEAGVSPAIVPEILVRLRAQHNESNLWRRTRPEVGAALSRLRASGRALAVISNSDGSCRGLLRRLDLLQYFERVYDSAEVGVEKPNERIFRLALGELGVEPSEAVYVGDLEAIDVRGAQGVGLLPVLVDPFGERRSSSYPVVRSVDELPATLGI